MSKISYLLLLIVLVLPHVVMQKGLCEIKEKKGRTKKNKKLIIEESFEEELSKKGGGDGGPGDNSQAIAVSLNKGIQIPEQKAPINNNLSQSQGVLKTGFNIYDHYTPEQVSEFFKSFNNLRQPHSYNSNLHLNNQSIPAFLLI